MLLVTVEPWFEAVLVMLLLPLPSTLLLDDIDPPPRVVLSARWAELSRI
jgi:hypothetical protein